MFSLSLSFIFFQPGSHAKTPETHFPIAPFVFLPLFLITVISWGQNACNKRCIYYDGLYLLAQPVASLVVFQACGLKKGKGHISIVTCGNSSHVVTSYFQRQPRDILFSDSLRFVVRPCLCVCFSCLTTKSSQSSQHCLVWCSQQLKHIPRFTHFFLLVLSVCTTSSRCQCHKGRPGIQCMPRFVRLTGCCSMMHVWGGQREDYDYKKGSEVVMCFPV